MSGPYDLFVIGGGVNGAAIARDAAGRGLRVGLCEKDDLAAHTSSASTKLIHGGLRYLEQGDFRLVREALAEREVLLRAAPHIVRPLSFVLPHHRGLRPAWMLGLGLFLYDRLAGRGSLPRSARVRLGEGATAGQLRRDFRVGFRYSDCRVDDSRLVVLLAMDAKARGADVMTRTACEGLRRTADGWVLTLRPAAGAPFETAARAVVNAAGAWAEDLRALAAADGRKPSRARLRLVKGSHIVTRRLYAGGHAFLFQNADGRVVFAIPFERDFTLIGTTDVPVASPEEGERIAAAEIDYLCAAASKYLAAPVTPGNVVRSFAGVRALADDGDDNPSKVSRDDALLLDAGADGAAPMLSVFGGKLTTHRRVAERALERLAPHLPGMGPAWTADAVLPGGDFDDFDAFVRTLERDHVWAPPAMLCRLAGAYGTRARDVLGDARRIEDLGRRFGADLYERELLAMIEHEFARTAEDALWRRSKRGLALTEDERRAVQERMGA